MTEEAVDEARWTEIDRYISDLFVSPDAPLEAALAASEAAGLPAIEVAPGHGKLLMLLATIVRARRILEIGTLAGYSAIWMARALPEDGKLISLEADARHAEIARRNVERAGCGAKVEIRLGPALTTLPKLAAEAAAQFDMVFIDADKPNNPAYFDWAIRLSRRGGVIVADNVVRYGALDEGSSGARNFMEIIAADRRVSATIIQTVSCKGHDGFALAVVTAGP
jgi:predicted O-methyltransferase YrrM